MRSTLLPRYKLVARLARWEVKDVVTAGVLLLSGLLPFYIPLRFQIPWLGPLPAYICLAEVFIFGFAAIQFAFSSRPQFHFLDFVVVAFFLHSALLIVFSDGENFDRLNALRRYVVPIGLYWASAHCFHRQSRRRLQKVLESCAVIVAVFYVAELYLYTFLKQGYFNWTIHMKQYSFAHGGGLSESQADFGDSMYIRLAGFFGHNHATSFFMGFGALLHYLGALNARARASRFLHFVLALFLGAVTLAAMCKTSILATAVGFLLIWILSPKRRVQSRKFLLTAGASVALIALVAIFSKPAILKLLIHPAQHFLVGSIGNNLVTDAVGTANSGLKEQWILHPWSLITGTGFVDSQSIAPIPNDEFFPAEILSRYGLIGAGLLLCLVFQALRLTLVNWKKAGRDLEPAALMPILYVLTLLVMFAHSSVFFYYQLFAFFFLLLGITRNLSDVA